MKTLYTLYIGVQSDKNSNYIPKLKSHTAVEQIQDFAATHFDGYTMSYTTGGWKDDDKMVKEHAVKFEIIADASHHGRINELALFAKQILNQSCVLVIQSVVHHEFV